MYVTLTPDAFAQNLSVFSLIVKNQSLQQRIKNSQRLYNAPNFISNNCPPTFTVIEELALSSKTPSSPLPSPIALSCSRAWSLPLLEMSLPQSALWGSPALCQSIVLRPLKAPRRPAVILFTCIFSVFLWGIYCLMGTGYVRVLFTVFPGFAWCLMQASTQL